MKLKPTWGTVLLAFILGCWTPFHFSQVIQWGSEFSAFAVRTINHEPSCPTGLKCQPVDASSATVTKYQQ